MRDGLGSGELEEYPEILPADEPHPIVGDVKPPTGKAIEAAFAPLLGILERREKPRNINLYGAEKTPRRRALKRLFDRLLGRG